MKRKYSKKVTADSEKTSALEFGIGQNYGLSRSYVTDEIWHLISGCYGFDINPLPILRRAIPNFKWEFHDLSKKVDSRAAVCARVIASDFFWLTNVFYDELITARRVNSVEKPFAIIGHTFQSMRESCASDSEGMIKLLQLWGVREDRESD